MKGNSDLTWGKKNHIEVVKYWNWCLERVWQLCPWRFSELDWTEAGAIRSSFEISSAEQQFRTVSLENSLPS